MLKLLPPFISMGLILTGCASHSTQAIGKLDSDKPVYRSQACQNARKNAWIYQEAKDTKLWAGPAVLVLAGPVAIIPLIVANTGVNTADHLKAADIASSCGGNPPNPEAVAGDIALGASLDIATGSIVPLSALGDKVSTALPTR